MKTKDARGVKTSYLLAMSNNKFISVWCFEHCGLGEGVVGTEGSPVVMQKVDNMCSLIDVAGNGGDVGVE
jgi:hypothetical protein